MRPYPNPFRARASEQHRDLRSFVVTFGPGALELLPTADSLWDRLLVIRSAPGAGKTSLMRVFTVETLQEVSTRLDYLRDLSEKLGELGAIADASPAVLGVLLNLSSDYRSLLDLDPSDARTERLFLQLLDARIMIGTLRATMALGGNRFPEDLDRVAFVALGDAPIDQEIARLGGTNGADIFSRCVDIEERILDALDSLLPVQWEEAELGHSDLYSLRLLSKTRLSLDAKPVPIRPLIMFDDAHELGASQRIELLRRLADRTLDVGRWISERYQALSHQDRMAAFGSKGRDFELLEIELASKGLTQHAHRKRFVHGRFEKVLVDIADRRASRALSRQSAQQVFSDLLPFNREDLLGAKPVEVLETVRDRVESRAASSDRYADWVAEARTLHGYEAAVHWREIEVLITRDMRRAQGELFDVVLDGSLAAERSSSALRDAAAFALAQEFNLPYFAGAGIMAKLGSNNVEQFLTICAALFSEISSALTLGRDPSLTPSAQDRIARRASLDYWRELPRRVPNGLLIQKLVQSIASIAQAENIRSTMPYPPGVTGTALLMSDRERLLDRGQRTEVRGAEELFTALSDAIAHNVILAEPYRRVKNNAYMVLYLNRLLCPRFSLVVGRGGFREKALETMAGWMIDAGGAPANGSPSAQRLEL